ncbi:DDE-type integrase/transposase/recombinase [Saccharopolyspora shandongensis]|uniref:DDE-type integrase/transposase/recombinase n=1 Tax=Saccharopolyspora shandongensis TaxID=418495 RepID=UPI00341AA4E5
MYRIARAAGQVRERRRQATHPPRTRPELLAHGPSQVWPWDITALKGPVKGIWYKCYVVMDIFSRYVTGWLVAAAEDAVVAKDFLGEAITRNGIEPHTIHADRGGAMVSKPVSELLTDLGVLRSHSRPRTSNDNPYSEAQFKTMKYVPDFPHRFGSLEDARAFCDAFFLAYNHEHRHSGIGLHTPASVHFGTAEQISAQRQTTLDRAHAAHPERFTRRPNPPALPQAAWINQPTEDQQLQRESVGARVDIRIGSQLFVSGHAHERQIGVGRLGEREQVSGHAGSREGVLEACSLGRHAQRRAYIVIEEVLENPQEAGMLLRAHDVRCLADVAHRDHPPRRHRST